MLSFYCAWLAKKRGSKYLELWQVIIAAGEGNIFYSESCTTRFLFEKLV